MLANDGRDGRSSSRPALRFHDAGYAPAALPISAAAGPCDASEAGWDAVQAATAHDDDAMRRQARAAEDTVVLRV